MRARSNSASAASTWSCSRPAGVVQSMPSPSDTNATPDRVQLVEERHQVAQVAPEPVEAPADQDVDSAAPGIADQAVERRAPILRTGHPVVDVLDGGRPAPRVDVAPQLGQLVLGLLVEGRDAGVDGGTHQSTPDSRNEW